MVDIVEQVEGVIAVVQIVDRHRENGAGDQIANQWRLRSAWCRCSSKQCR